MPATTARRLRRSDCSGEGIRRKGSGRGFFYLDTAGRRIEDTDTLERLSQLAIPPAWKDVWVCPDPMGHIQATGTDAAGRKQYLYHDRWHARSAARKFESMREFAETNESYGVATVLREHVTISDGEVVFDFPAKSGQRRVQSVRDPQVHEAVEAMRRRRSGPEDLLVFKEDGSWHDVRSEDVNAYLQEKVGEQFSAKDFRTWHGTVLAAVELAAEGPPESKSAAERTIRSAVGRVAEQLGNTPAVCRSSYIDPAVLDRFREGRTIDLPDTALTEELGPRQRTRIERQVLDLIQ